MQCSMYESNVCMYVCMNAMYVCMYVCSTSSVGWLGFCFQIASGLLSRRFAFEYPSKDHFLLTSGSMYVYMYVCIYVCMDVCMDVCDLSRYEYMYVCMYVCMYEKYEL